MRKFLKLFVIAAAVGLAPAAALGQAAAPTPAPAPVMRPSAPPSDAISAQSQAAPAQPQQSSDPAMANITGEAPSDAQVAQAATFTSPTHPVYGVGQPDGRAGLQDQFTPIGQEAYWFHEYILMPAIIAISVFVLL